jgi:hypothetical protein
MFLIDSLKGRGKSTQTNFSCANVIVAPELKHEMKKLQNINAKQNINLREY